MKSVKSFVLLFAILSFVIIGLCVGIKLFSNKNKSYVDKNGYLHTKDAGDIIAPVEKPKDAVIVVPMDKEEAFFNAITGNGSGYEFLSYALSYINGGNEYTIFKFSDDTGLYVTKDAQTTAIYGEIEDQNIVQDIGYISIDGMNLYYRSAPDYVSKESRNVAKLIPQEYQTDGLYVRISDEEAYICIAEFEENSKEAAADKTYDAIKSVIGDKPCTIIVNESFKYTYPKEIGDEEKLDE